MKFAILLACLVGFASFARADDGILHSGLEAVPDEVLKGIKVRVLDTHSDRYVCAMSRDANLALLFEKGASGKQRYALWNVNEGKLVRFLSLNLGRSTSPYEGDDVADFGAEVDTQPGDVSSAVFSTDNKLVAILTQPRGAGIPGVALKDEVVIWETATGKMLRRIQSSYHYPNGFCFVDKSRIALKALCEGGYYLELVDGSTGEVEQLFKPSSREFYAGVAVDKMFVVQIPENRLLGTNVDTKESMAFKPPPKDLSNSAAKAIYWQSAEKQLLLFKDGTIEKWNLATKSYASSLKIVPKERSFDLLQCAPDAGLVAVRRIKPRRIEFLRVSDGAVVSVLKHDWERTELAGVSSDAQRIAVWNDKRQLLVMDFPDAIPAGNVSIPKLLEISGAKPRR